jgi:hypothetical protein
LVPEKAAFHGWDLNDIVIDNLGRGYQISGKELKR